MEEVKLSWGTKAVVGIAVVCVGISQTLVDAMVACVLWNWFMVPLGVPHIRTSQAVGLAMLAAMFNNSPCRNKDESNLATLYRCFVMPFVRAGLALLIGYIALHYYRA